AHAATPSPPSDSSRSYPSRQSAKADPCTFQDSQRAHNAATPPRRSRRWHAPPAQAPQPPTPIATRASPAQALLGLTDITAGKSNKRRPIRRRRVSAIVLTKRH